MSAWEGSSGLLIGIVIAGRTLVNALPQVPFGKLCDRFNKLTILTGSATCLVLTVVCIPWMVNFTQMLILYLFLGTAEAAVWAVLGAYASIEAKEHYGHGTMMGVFAMTMSFGVFLGAVISGVTMDKWGIIVAFTVAGCTVLGISLTAAAMIRLHNIRWHRNTSYS